MHILHFLFSYQNDYSLYNRHGQWGPDKWDHCWKSRLNESDPRALLAAACRCPQLSEQSSTIKYSDFGLGVFSPRPFGKGELVGWYYQSWVFPDLGLRVTAREQYGDSMLSVSVSEFHNWANELSLEV